MRWHCIIAMLVISWLFCQPQPAYAEILLDDFDVPNQLIMPEDFDHPFIINAGVSEPDVVGDHALARLLFLAANGAVDPIGSLDSAVANPSAVTFDLTTPNWCDCAVGFVTSSISYQTHPDPSERQPFDISEAGRNNAFILDFNHVAIEGDPAVLRAGVLVTAHGTRWYAPAFQELRPHPEPFSIVIPFDDFRREGGGGPPPPVPSFTNAEEVIVNFRAYNFVDSANVQIDSVRIGRVLHIPEPSSFWLTCCGVIALAVYGNSLRARMRPPC